MDDTIENLGIAWVNMLNERYNLEANFEDSKEFDLCKLFPSLKPEAVYGPLYNPDLWKNVAPKEDAIEYVKRLIDDGHEFI